MPYSTSFGFRGSVSENKIYKLDRKLRDSPASPHLFTSARTHRAYISWSRVQFSGIEIYKAKEGMGGMGTKYHEYGVIGGFWEDKP